MFLMVKFTACLCLTSYKRRTSLLKIKVILETQQPNKFHDNVTATRDEFITSYYRVLVQNRLLIKI